MIGLNRNSIFLAHVALSIERIDSSLAQITRILISGAKGQCGHFIFRERRPTWRFANQDWGGAGQRIPSIVLVPFGADEMLPIGFFVDEFINSIPRIENDRFCYFLIP